jgi:hypothetical protein
MGGTTQRRSWKRSWRTETRPHTTHSYARDARTADLKHVKCRLPKSRDHLRALRNPRSSAPRRRCWVFREVPVVEAREVLRLWVRGHGLRETTRTAGRGRPQDCPPLHSRGRDSRVVGAWRRAAADLNSAGPGHRGIRTLYLLNPSAAPPMRRDVYRELAAEAALAFRPAELLRSNMYLISILPHRAKRRTRSRCWEANQSLPVPEGHGDDQAGRSTGRHQAGRPQWRLR